LYQQYKFSVKFFAGATTIFGAGQAMNFHRVLSHRVVRRSQQRTARPCVQPSRATSPIIQRVHFHTDSILLCFATAQRKRRQRRKYWKTMARKHEIKATMDNAMIKKHLQLKGVLPGNKDQLEQWKFEESNRKTYGKMIFEKKKELSAYLKANETITRGPGGNPLQE